MDSCAILPKDFESQSSLPIKDTDDTHISKDIQVNKETHQE